MQIFIFALNEYISIETILENIIQRLIVKKKHSITYVILYYCDVE